MLAGALSLALLVGLLAADPTPGEAKEEGPWGELESIPIVIGPSLEYIPSLMPDRRGNRWFFPKTSIKDLNKFIGTLRLSEQERTRLLAVAEPASDIQGVVVTPDPKIVAGLSPTARRAIYARLALYPGNFDQVNASHFPAELADAWLSPLPEPARSAIRRLMYPSGGFLLFADLPLVLTEIKNRDQQGRVIQVLAKQQTYLLKLRVRKGSDINRLAEYWGRGGRRKDVRPLLESLATTDEGQTIDVIHLLPPFARRHLYTFPLPSIKTAATGYDCHYASFNFFNDLTEEKFISPSEVVSILGEKYHPIYANPELGDLVIYVTDNNEIIHSAVYVAADMLFTKYGNSPAQPWMLMTFDEVKDFYPVNGELKVRFFRPNHLD
jgi:hypothetical protein